MGCGDSSDEETMECELAKQDSFEDDDTPFGMFTHNSEHHDFEWERGSGMIEGNFTTGPPFDHTTFGEQGHYLFIRSSEQNKNENAQLISKPFKGNQNGNDHGPSNNS